MGIGYVNQQIVILIDRERTLKNINNSRDENKNYLEIIDNFFIFIFKVKLYISRLTTVFQNPPFFKCFFSFPYIFRILIKVFYLLKPYS